MRVLVIGFPLPNPRFDNYNLLTAPSWFDYDAMFIDPLSVSTVIEDVVQAREEHRTRADEPVLNRPSTPLSVGLAETIRRRRAECAQLLAGGGTVVVLGRPQAVHEGVTGFPGCDRYAFLPAPAGLSYEPPFMLRAEGTEVRVTDGGHPFAPLVERYQRWFAYRVRFDETVPGFANWGQVCIRSAGGAAIGLEIAANGGRIVFLPAFASIAYGDQRFELATALLDAVRRMGGLRERAPAPSWTGEFALPGSAEQEAAEQKAAEAVAAAEARLAELSDGLVRIHTLRGLLWQDNAGGLEEAAQAALAALGFDVETDPEKPHWIADGSLRAFYEVEGSTEAVGEAPFVRLQRRLQADLLATRQPKHGLIVYNGCRLVRPDDRLEQCSESLRLAADTYGYATISGEQLFEFVAYVLAEPLDAVRRSILRRRLLEATGDIGRALLIDDKSAGGERAPSEAPAEAS